jgi:NAD(P)-dependent dehydrogenase (short-subunit alcohol dehydrogenase family)
MENDSTQNYFLVGANSTSAKALVGILAERSETERTKKFVSLGLYCKNPEALRLELEEKINLKAFKELKFYEGNALNYENLKSSFDNFKETVNEVQGLVHFPGSVLLKPATSTKIEEFEEVISTNLTSAFIALKACLPSFKAQGNQESSSKVLPSIVFISSVAAKLGLPNHEAIAAAKGGLEALARTTAASSTYVRCNCVAPGLIDAKMTSKIVQNEKALAASISLNAIKRVGIGADIANAVEFLLSEKSSFITGQVIGVDGGMSTVGFPKM